MLSVFPTLVCRPTLSKMATRALKAPWSQAGSDEAAIPLSADGGREDIHRTTERESGVQGVWDGNHGWVHVESHDDSAWEGRNTAAPLGPPDKWGAQDV